MSWTYHWHDDIMLEMKPTILESLEDHRVVSIERTEQGIRIVEQCDLYHGLTLSLDQFRRLLSELQGLLEEVGV